MWQPRPTEISPTPRHISANRFLRYLTKYVIYLLFPCCIRMTSSLFLNWYCVGCLELESKSVSRRIHFLFMSTFFSAHAACMLASFLSTFPLLLHNLLELHFFYIYTFLKCCFVTHSPSWYLSLLFWAHITNYDIYSSGPPTIFSGVLCRKG